MPRTRALSEPYDADRPLAVGRVDSGPLISRERLEATRVRALFPSEPGTS